MGGLELHEDEVHILALFVHQADIQALQAKQHSLESGRGTVNRFLHYSHQRLVVSFHDCGLSIYVVLELCANMTASSSFSI